MHREVVLAWLALLFGLMAAMLTVAAVLTSWPVLLLAAPLAGMAGLLWYHASGRLEDRMRQHARRRRARRERAAAASAGAAATNGARAERRTRGDPRGARTAGSAAGPRAGPRGPFGAADSRFGGRGRAADQRRRAAAGAAGRAGAGGAATAEPDGMSRDRALSVLDLDPGADDDAIRAAYRDKVKETHPDRGGDRDAFIQVTEAYEALGGTA